MESVGEPVSRDEIESAYLPLVRLLGMHIDAAAPRTGPFVIAVAGSVAVGKSTFARVLRVLLSRLAPPMRVELVTTDGFLYPNSALERMGLMDRKGFPESYDLAAMSRFLQALKEGADEVRAPLYSHATYDVMEGESQRIGQHDVLLLEGLGALDARPGSPLAPFVDFSVYLDAEEADIERWFIERFLALCRTAFKAPDSYFRRFGAFTPEEATAYARRVWRDVNGVNLHEHILPTRAFADVVLRKASDHTIREAWLK